MNNRKSAGILLVLLGMLLTSGSLNAQKVLFSSNFTDLEENWEVVDDPTAERGPGQWRVGLVEMSGIKTRENTMATALLAGENDWQNYSIETSLTMASPEGYLVGILCGYQDPTHFYYVHIANASDAHANSIFIVDAEPRVSIAETRTEGTKWDDGWHTVRLVRDAEKGTIEVFFDDSPEPIMTAVNDSFDWGGIGVGSFDDTGQFDDIRLWGIEQ